MSNILICGDKILDHYFFCKATRLCPEAPCPVLHIERTKVRAGGAMLVAANLISLGGNDIVECYGSSSRKFRFYAGHTLITRVDRDKESVTEPAAYWKDLEPALRRADVVIASDYGKGAFTDDIAAKLIVSGKRVFVDAKINVERWSGAFASFPNEHEELVLSHHVIRKKGSEGCVVDGTSITSVPQQVYDVTGAGDVFLAAFVWDYLKSNDLLHAARMANRAAGESVKHLGTYVVSRKDMVL